MNGTRQRRRRLSPVMLGLIVMGQLVLFLLLIQWLAASVDF